MNSKGYSLVEVSVVLGILMASVLAWLALSDTLLGSTKVLDAVNTVSATGQLARENLKYEVTCSNAVSGGLNTSGFTTSAILSNSKSISLRLPGILNDGTPGDDILTAGVNLKSVRVTDVKLFNAINMGGGLFFSQVRMDATVRSSGMPLRPVELGNFYFRTSGGAIVACENPNSTPVPLCEEMGCTWNPLVTPNCQCPSIDLSCPDHYFATGVDASGKPICTPLGSGPCPPDTYVQRLEIGTTVCVPLPPPAGAVVNGLCGGANGGAFADATAANSAGLCSDGTPVPAVLAGAGPWSWTCNGSGGGTNDSCSATAGPVCSAGMAAICLSNGAVGLVAASNEICSPTALGVYESSSVDCHRSAAPTTGTGYDRHCMTCPAAVTPSPGCWQLTLVNSTHPSIYPGWSFGAEFLCPSYITKSAARPTGSCTINDDCEVITKYKSETFKCQAGPCTSYVNNCYWRANYTAPPIASADVGKYYVCPGGANEMNPDSGATDPGGKYCSPVRVGETLNCGPGMGGDAVQRGNIECMCP